MADKQSEQAKQLVRAVKIVDKLVKRIQGDTADLRDIMGFLKKSKEEK